MSHVVYLLHVSTAGAEGHRQETVIVVCLHLVAEQEINTFNPLTIFSYVVFLSVFFLLLLLSYCNSFYVTN